MTDNQPKATLMDWIRIVDERLCLNMNQQQINGFVLYGQMLQDWNRRINLTAVADDKGMAIRHFLDSLTLVPILDQLTAAHKRPLKLIDVGSGAGFPGLPIKIVRSRTQVLLLDSLNKRIKFLDAVIEALGLAGIATRHARAEDAARQPALRERFDVATARAVASLPVLCEYCLPFVRVGGVFLAMKGQDEEEIAAADHAIQALGGRLAETSRFNLPGTDMKRTIVTIEKITDTPAVYPRKAGKPEREPIQNTGLPRSKLTKSPAAKQENPLPRNIF
jgi:16S rRNA (guanine527-N7)-methyltransferase